MNQPLVSCIIPMYNSEKTITECLNSLLEIDYEPIEVIVVDDGSQDESRKVVKDFIEKYCTSRITFKIIGDRVNRGISSAKNLGMEKINGEFFFFAASDDIQLSNRIKEPLAYLQKYPEVDVLYLDCDLYVLNSKGLNVSKRGFPSSMTNQNAFLYQITRSYFWSGLFLARSRARLPFDEALSSAVDYDWYFKQYFQKRIIHFMDESVMRYRLHDSNTSKNLSETSSNVVRILKKYDFDKEYKSLKDEAPSDLVNLSFARLDFTLSRYEECLSKLYKIRIKCFDSEFLRAMVYLKMNQYDKSSKIFEKLCKENINRPECFNNLAVSRIKDRGDYNEAKALLEKAISLNGDYLDARRNLELLANSSSKDPRWWITVSPLRDVLTHRENYE
jgi:glycosyltransferase involved in cell wall biosynthesis